MITAVTPERITNGIVSELFHRVCGDFGKLLEILRRLLGNNITYSPSLPSFRMRVNRLIKVSHSKKCGTPRQTFLSRPFFDQSRADDELLRIVVQTDQLEQRSDDTTELRILQQEVCSLKGEHLVECKNLKEEIKSIKLSHDLKCKELDSIINCHQEEIVLLTKKICSYCKGRFITGRNRYPH